MGLDAKLSSWNSLWVAVIFNVFVWNPSRLVAFDPDCPSQDRLFVPSPPLELRLPFPPQTAYLVIQGVGGRFSHYGMNYYAVDFAMPEGSVVCAAAAGRVVCVQQRFKTNTMDPTARTRANRIVIDHGNGYFTQYLHLLHNSALVKEGDIVTQGQPIGRSGNTGYSSQPHLHFQLQDTLGQSVPLRFADVPGDGVPMEGKEYISQNKATTECKTIVSSPFPRNAFLQNGIEVYTTTLPGVLIPTDRIYRISGKTLARSTEGVIFLLPPEGGTPLWSQRFPIQNDGSFDFDFTFQGLRAVAPEWSTELHESNPFALAITLVDQNGSYWSDVSVPVFLR